LDRRSRAVAPREGLTTYYTTLSRARAGFLTREQAWDELLDGFERGKRTGTGRTLRDESAAMHQSGAYWRVYWAGAALALLADVELRRAGSRDGLDGPVRAIASCCASSDELWDSERLAHELDRAARVPVMQRLAAKHLDEQHFPDLEATTEFLGVHALGSAIELDPKAAGAQIRDAIVPKLGARTQKSGKGPGGAGLQKK
jgi:predicted metalloprotease with PDZ domain